MIIKVVFEAIYLLVTSVTRKIKKGNGINVMLRINKTLYIFAVHKKRRRKKRTKKKTHELSV